jgi:ubiquinol-cytochrome c reductase cytochrome c1 subunit
MVKVRIAAPVALALALLALGGAPAARSAAEEAAPAGYGADWASWRAGTSVSDRQSLQRGARDFLAYCGGCHSLKYVRYSRLGDDLDIGPDLLMQYLVPKGRKPTDYITAPMPQADAAAWFGKAPPDLSLIARARGTDYLFQFLMTFYVDPSRPTGVNNLAKDTVAMPHVLSPLQGVQRAVFKNVQTRAADGKEITAKVFDHFEQLAEGQLSREQYAAFVRDIVNFLDYTGEPAQAHRRALGVWVVLFLLVLSWLAWLLKTEYWKDVH